MSPSVHTSAPVAGAEASSPVASLRTLYFIRFAFAIVWAGLLAFTSSTLTPISIALLGCGRLPQASSS